MIALLVLFGMMMLVSLGCSGRKATPARKRDTPSFTHKRLATKDQITKRFLKQLKKIYQSKEQAMKPLTHAHYLQAQMMTVAGLLEHTKDNLKETCFCDDPELFDVVDKLQEGADLVVARMKQIIRVSSE